MIISSTQALIDDIRLGKMIVLMDDEDRENEGDLIMAAEKITPEAVNFMIKYGRGLLCLPLSAAKCDALQLPMMAVRNGSKFHTNFTVSIEAASGVTTGISAYDRAHTIATAAHPHAQANELVMPGHIFPIRAVAGGVLKRRGHTEASVDLARLAGFQEAAVLCEILNDNGTMARRPDLEVFAKTHGLKLGTIKDLVEYRLAMSAIPA